MIFVTFLSLEKPESTNKLLPSLAMILLYALASDPSFIKGTNLVAKVAPLIMYSSNLSFGL